MLSEEFKLAIQNWSNDTGFAVDFDLLWRGLGYARKDSALRLLSRSGLTEDTDYTLLINVECLSSGGSTRRHKYWLTVKAAKQLCMMADTATGRQVRLYFLECEEKAHVLDDFVARIAPMAEEMRKIQARQDARPKRY
jgi:phage anti-repressor protein